MDRQHVALHALITAIAVTTDSQELATQLDALIEQTRAHFQCEEQWMEASGYTHMAEHLREHRRLLGELEMMRRRLRPATLPLVRAFIRERLPEWLTQHLRGIDSTLAAHLALHHHSGQPRNPKSQRSPPP